MRKTLSKSGQVLRHLSELQARLSEAEDTLDAIRSGSVDALVVRTPRGEQLFTLKGADQTYRALVEAMNEGAVTLKQGVVSYCNNHFAETVRAPLEKVIGASIFDFVESPQFRSLLSRLKKGKATAGTLEAELRAGDGTLIPALFSASRFYSEGSAMVSLVVTDITERKRNEAALRESEHRFQMVARTSSDVIWDWDVAKNRVWRSEGFMKLFRYSPGEVNDTFEWWQERVHPEHRREVLASLWAAVKGHSNDLYTATYPFRCGDGSYVFISDCACVLRDENQKAIRVIGFRRDISKQIEAERARLGLSRSILNAQEQERQRVARDLHDSVNQLLSSVNYRLYSIGMEYAGPAAGTIREVRELVEKAIAEVRLISRNLRPSELDDLGLVPALRSLTRDFQKRSAIVAHFDSRVSRSASPTSKEAEMTLYRIAQEALNNVEKHSRATRVDVRFKRLANQASLLIQDNGKGMPQPPARRRKPGWGLHNMTERAALLNGRVEIASGARQGTAVMVQIPLNNAPEKRTKQAV